MKNELGASLLMLAVLLLTAACAGQGHRVSDAAAEPPPAVSPPGVLVSPPTGMPSPTEGLAPIPGHPPVTMSGRLKSVDTKLGTITFEDERTAMLTSESEILVPASVDRVQPGIPIVVRNALPVGVWSKRVAGAPDAASAAHAVRSQRMATVEAIDESDQVVQLTDGTAVRMSPSTHVHRGLAGPAIGLADLRPGDELVIVTPDDASTTAGGEPAPSASPGATTSPRAPSEVMVFSPAVTP
jgi:hypothetical protein